MVNGWLDQLWGEFSSKYTTNIWIKAQKKPFYKILKYKVSHLYDERTSIHWFTSKENVNFVLTHPLWGVSHDVGVLLLRGL